MSFIIKLFSVLFSHPEKGWNSVKLAQPVSCVPVPPPDEVSHDAGVWDAAFPPESLKFAVQPGPVNMAEQLVI